MALTFQGGLILPGKNGGGGEPVSSLPLPEKLYIDLPSDCTGYEPAVEEGASVLTYQRLGDILYGDERFPVYTGCGGTLEGYIRNREGALRKIVIKTAETAEAPLQGFPGTLSDLTADEIIERVRAAAIPCRGYFRYASKKLTAAKGKANALIINCCESEPGASSRRAVVREDINSVLDGAKLIMKVLDLRRCVISVDEEKDGIQAIVENNISKDPLFQAFALKPKYPQDDEAILIRTLSGARSENGHHPESTGKFVFDAEVAADIYRAVVLGVPYCRRVVSAGVKNVYCPVGAPVSALLEYADVEYKTAKMLIRGGYMRGKACKEEDGIDKDTDIVTVIGETDRTYPEKIKRCVLCGECVRSCPAGLLPHYFAEKSVKKQYVKCEKYGLFTCIECGCCDYVCPSGIPIKRLVKTAKKEIQTGRRVTNNGKKG